MIDILKICQNRVVTTIADNYYPAINENGQISYEKLFNDQLTKIDVKELRIPVLGIQGTGKSSLINAIIFGDIVLPADADETTCIPIEIRYHDKNNIDINVFFKKGTHLNLSDYADLNQYVNNRFNPGNIKGVDKVIIKTKNDLLSNDIVLVDLPGVRSLTTNNENVTMKYLEEMAFAIFLIGTVPPITRPESIFLKLAWSKLSGAMFVQNVYKDENASQIEEGLNYNKKVLEDIRKEKNMSNEIFITPVKIKNALDSKVINNKALLEESNIDKVCEYIRELGKDWRNQLQKMFILYVSNIIRSTILAIEEKLSNVRLNEEELKNKIKLEEKEYSVMLQTNAKKIMNINSEINTFESETIDLNRKKCKDAKKNLRNNMRTAIKGGIIDGDKLTRTYNDNQKNESENVAEEVYLRLEEIQKKLSIDIGSLEVRRFDKSFKNFAVILKEESFKIEKVFTEAGTITGAILGPIIVGALIGGPVGLVVGIIASITGGMLGGLIGSEAKNTVKDIRSESSLKDLDPTFDIFEKNLRDCFDNIIEELFKHLRQSLDDFKKSEENILKEKKEKNNELLNMNLGEKQILITTMQSDFEKIKKEEDKING